MSNLKLSPASRALFKLCGLPDIDGMEIEAGLAMLDEALGVVQPGDVVEVVNLRIAEKIRSIRVMYVSQTLASIGHSTKIPENNYYKQAIEY